MSEEPSAPPLSVPPAESLPSRLSAMNIGSQAEASGLSSVGTSPVQSMFTQGSVMMLQSVASGSTLCINDGEVSGKGIRNSHSQFVVHVRRPGVLSLQCVADPDGWLEIYEGKVVASGGGGPYSEFHLREVEDKYVALESVCYPGQHLGVLEDGELKPASETPALDRASLFIPFPHTTPTQEYPPATYTRAVSSDDLPPPYPGPPQNRQSQGYGYLAAGVAMGAAAAMARPQPTPYQQPVVAYQPAAAAPRPQPTPYRHSLMAYQPPPQAPYLQQEAYPQQHYLPPQGYQQPVIVPSGPTTPVGYVLSDLFNRFNTLTFIPSIDVSGRPLAVCRGVFGNPTVRCGGSYVGKDRACKWQSHSFASHKLLVDKIGLRKWCAMATSCEYEILSATGEFVIEAVGQGVVVLANMDHGRVAVTDAKKVFVFRTPYKQGETMMEFVIRSVSGAVVAFESLKFPGHYLSVGKDGLVKLEQHSLESQNVRFTVRVNKFNGPYSQVIMSPFTVGKPSLINQLKDRSVIQLYHKPTMMFLCLKEGGSVKSIQREENGTFLIFCDRGMGRVSLKSYHRDLLKLKMTFNGTLTSVGAEDVNGDFYVKENQNGTIMFESVPFPGKYVHIIYLQGKHKVQVCEFSVFQLDMNRSVGQGVNRTVPKYALN